MKAPKRNKKLVKHLQEVQDVLKFYMGKDGAKELLKKLEEVESELEALSLEKKLDHIRLIKKWEAIQKNKAS